MFFFSWVLFGKVVWCMEYGALFYCKQINMFMENLVTVDIFQEWVYIWKPTQNVAGKAIKRFFFCLPVLISYCF